MLSREEVEQMIKESLEPITEEIATLKAQLGKVDLLAIDTRNIRQSLERLETSQESLRLGFERQEKRTVRFEKQTNDQLTKVNDQLAKLNENDTTMNEKLDLVTAMLRRLLPPENQR